MMKSINDSDPKSVACLWSARLKHPQIQLHGRLASRCPNSLNYDAIVLGTAALRAGNTLPYKWSINIV